MKSRDETRSRRSRFASSRLFSRRDHLGTGPRFSVQKPSAPSSQKKAASKSVTQKELIVHFIVFSILSFSQTHMRYTNACRPCLEAQNSFRHFYPLLAFPLGLHLFQHRQFVRKTVVVCVHREIHNSGTCA